ncbi:TRAP transporter 4TM/12TM fusion protein [Arthrobacter pigmenti]|uniref:TRAP transporter 4TM/12TM fusion protein n=1 Tax=Arthrobacter pigmenti TaxID=271432 RepID=A0A846RUG8_9MICC|nr:TRAP transporter permease [Arthrobacter pigmenti]NJC23787.1 TRAP transporter 4TM/12TM fusion protein [Arthrobacter pigmenti]
MSSVSEAPVQVEDEATTLKRDLEGTSRSVLYGLSVLMALTQIYLIIFATASPMVHTAIFLAFIVPLVLLSYRPMSRARTRSIPWYDWIAALVSSAPFIYVAINYEDIIRRAIVPTTVDQTMAVIACVAILEISRRAIGFVLPLIALIFLFYTVWGGFLPGILSHRGYELDRITNTLFMTSNGVFGSAAQVAATMVFMFVFFGAFLNATGASRVITQLAFSVAGRYTGGPAKVAVIASGGMGMVSGSASANVATTGQVTIPLMKQVGYRGVFAAAVEAAASTAGTLTPPIMGAAAFIMAEITGIPYAEIVIAGIIPAILFYVTVLMCVHFEASRLGLKGMDKADIPKASTVMKKGIFILSPVIMLAVLIFMYYPVMYAAFYATIALVVIALVHPSIPLSPKGIVNSIANSADMVLQAGAACACAGLVIGVLNLTGLGLRFSSWTLGIAGASVILALIFTMLITIVLGMGLPPVAAYIVAASVAAPALTTLGFPLLASHMFIFYFSCLSSITPPVGITAFIAAGIARARPMRTAFTACFLALPAFVVPFLFIYSPAFLLEGEPLEIVGVSIKALLGFVFISAGVIGFVRKHAFIWERVMFILGGSLVLSSNFIPIAVGVVLVAVALLFHSRRSGRARATDSSVNDKATESQSSV